MTNGQILQGVSETDNPTPVQGVARVGFGLIGFGVCLWSFLRFRSSIHGHQMTETHLLPLGWGFGSWLCVLWEVMIDDSVRMCVDSRVIMSGWISEYWWTDWPNEYHCSQVSIAGFWCLGFDWWTPSDGMSTVVIITSWCSGTVLQPGLVEHGYVGRGAYEVRWRRDSDGMARGPAWKEHESKKRGNRNKRW